MDKIGTRYIEIGREGWRCNICGYMTFSDKIKHKCRSAPHFLGSRYSRYIVTEKQQKLIRKYVEKIIK